VRAISVYGGIEVKLYSFILNAGELSLAIGELRKEWSSSSVWHQGVSRDNLKSDVNELKFATEINRKQHGYPSHMKYYPQVST
jgi:hypothetical protein